MRKAKDPRKRSKPQIERTPSGRIAKLLALLERHPGKLAVAFVVLATLRIVSVYPVYNHTIDEPAHIACGMEWLQQGTYRLEAQHPPLGRVAVAIGPRLAGARYWGRGNIYNEGAAILYDGRFDEARYWLLLTLARLGILPFFWMACAVVYLWARTQFNPTEAVVSVFLFTLIPPVLAHAGLATTDMPLTAGFALAAAAFALWLDRPDWRRSVMLGIGLALMVLTKFSSFVLYPAFVFGLLVLRKVKRQPLSMRWSGLLGAFVLAAGIIWATYRFSVGKGPFNLTVPAPELWSGLQAVWEHNRKGHPAYLLGQWSESGWWHYYPVVLLLKTPLPLLLLALLGARHAWQREPQGLGPIALGGSVLLAATLSRINIGVRHILPIYVAVALLACLPINIWLRSGRGKLVPVLLIATVFSGVLTHPDYLAYTNLLAGNRPERFLADSDLDWGQDMKRLAARLRDLRATQVAFNPLIAAHLERVHGFPPITPSHPFHPEPGWNAVSITVWKVARMGLEGEHRGAQLWPDRFEPVERVGRGVLLYYFPPAFVRPAQP